MNPMATPDLEDALIEKIRHLPPEQVVEVADFVDSLAQRHRDQSLTDAAARMSAASFQAVWDNADDAEYDKL